MGAIANILRRPFRVRYRAAIIVRGRTLNAYGTDRRQLATLARRTEGMTYWTLYKSGPCGLPERVIDFGAKELEVSTRPKPVLNRWKTYWNTLSDEMQN